MICTGAGAPNVCDNIDHAGLSNENLLEFSMQTKFGCDFGIDFNGVATTDASIWNVSEKFISRRSSFLQRPGP